MTSICTNCFSDDEVKGFIIAEGVEGTCTFCNSTNVQTIELTELQDFFQELIDNFEPDEDGDPIVNKIFQHWSLFSDHSKARIILNKAWVELDTNINNTNVPVSFNSEIRANISYWQTLKDDLKWSSRFITNLNYLTDELGWDGFFDDQFELMCNNTLYRARVHHESGLEAFKKDEMSCPLPNKTTEGRVNPAGIPVLYLSDSIETVFYEVRATYLDEISVGSFTIRPKKSQKKVKIVDFTKQQSLFQPNMINSVIKSTLLKEKISSDLSKPMRRYDSALEYIPTQFICEFIKKYTGASGIRFGSSLYPSGNNYVIFDKDLMECKEVSIYKITKLDLKGLKLDKD